MKQKLGFLLVLVAILLLLPTSDALAKRRARKAIEVQGGAPIEAFGFVVDASYDSRLDKLVPGYKVVNVAFVNNSFNIIILNPKHDNWFVKVSSKKRHRAIVDLRHDDVEAWNQLPERAKSLISYPLAVPIGGRMAIDLFVPENISVENLTEVSLELASIGQRIDVSVSQ